MSELAYPQQRNNNTGYLPIFILIACLFFILAAAGLVIGTAQLPRAQVTDPPIVFSADGRQIIELSDHAKLHSTAVLAAQCLNNNGPFLDPEDGKVKIYRANDIDTRFIIPCSQGDKFFKIVIQYEPGEGWRSITAHLKHRVTEWFKFEANLNQNATLFEGELPAQLPVFEVP